MFCQRLHETDLAEVETSRNTNAYQKIVFQKFYVSL